MNTNSSFLERYALPIYLILTQLISLAIAFFLPVPVIVIALLLLVVPSSLAILLTALAEGRKSLADLLKKLFQWRISLRWYAVALGLPVGSILASSALAVLLGWAPSVQFSVPERSTLIVTSIFVPFVAILEELGWRGYALPRLLQYRSPLSSALIIGIAWGLFHLGLGLRDGRPWLPTFLNPLAASVAITWLFVHTRGSLAMAMLYHFALDYSPQFFLLGLTTAQAVWAQTIVNLAAALILIVIFGVNLQRGPVREPAVIDAVLVAPDNQK
jgi:membrane protease YdiL (CAAX protease family)